MRVSVGFHFNPFLSQVNWLLRFFDSTALGPSVMLRAITCFDKGPETEGFTRVLGVAGFISTSRTRVILRTFKGFWKVY